MRELSTFWCTAIENLGRFDFSLWGPSSNDWSIFQQRPFEELYKEMGQHKQMPLKKMNERIQTRWHTITLADESYPPRLRNTPYAPPVLFFQGDLQCLEQPTMGVVGTRRCSPYGRRLGHRIASRLAGVGFTVVSGLAFGIDAAAHKGALRSGRTVAVVAHGLSHTSPRTHTALRREIVGNGGLIISAWPDDVPPRPFRFPIRNRWIAGLSDQLLVVEAPLRSGALSTAQFAIEWGRPVWAVPGSVKDASSAGCNRLIADGAGVVWDVDAALEYWSGIRGPNVAEWLSWVFDGVPLETVSKRTGQTVVQLLSTLSRLEVSGKVVRIGGQQYIEGVLLP